MVSLHSEMFPERLMSQGVVNRICKCNLSPSYCHYLNHNYVVLAKFELVLVP